MNGEETESITENVEGDKEKEEIKDAEQKQIILTWERKKGIGLQLEIRVRVGQKEGENDMNVIPAVTLS